MTAHAIVPRDDWLKARKALMATEKDLTRLRDRVAEDRRSLPWVRLDKTYVFDSADGPRTLGDLFDGRGQLFVQHFMMAPGDLEGCVGCSFEADHVDAARQHFEQRDVSFAAVARAGVAEIEAYRRRMGWTFAWVSSGRNDFNYDFGVSFRPEDVARGDAVYNYAPLEFAAADLPGISVFARDDTGSVFHAYSSYGRGAEVLLGAYAYLDFTPRGRDEPEGGSLIDWVKRHDDYDRPAIEACCAPQAAR